MGALWETLSFIFGALGAHDQQNVGFATARLILFLLAPLWINAFVYMTISRMVHFYIPDQKAAGIRSTLISRVFVWSDIVTFIVQAVGGMMTAPGSDATTIQNGLNIYIAGIGLQQACIAVFFVVMIFFGRRASAVDRSTGNYGSPSEQAAMPKKSWRATLYGLYAVLVFITVSFFSFFLSFFLSFSFFFFIPHPPYPVGNAHVGLWH
jgi:hypothetical protein